MKNVINKIFTVRTLIEFIIGAVLINSTSVYAEMFFVMGVFVTIGAILYREAMKISTGEGS